MPFKDTNDLYDAGWRDWTCSERNAAWRFLSHVVDHAESDEEYRDLLSSFDIGRMNHLCRVLLKLHLDDVPQCYLYLSEGDEAKLKSVEPLDPPVSLSDAPLLGIAEYREMGVLV